MFRPSIDLALLAAAACLVIAGLITYPDVPLGVLATAVAVAALLLAPVGAGHRTSASADREQGQVSAA